MRVAEKPSRQTKAAAKCRKDAKRARRGMYAAATFASMATVMLSAGPADADAPPAQTPPPPAGTPQAGSPQARPMPLSPSDLSGIGGAVAGRVLDPSQQAALNGALGVAGGVSSYTPFGNQVNEAINSYREGATPRPMPAPEPGTAPPAPVPSTTQVGAPTQQAGQPMTMPPFVPEGLAPVVSEIAGKVPAPVVELAATAAQIAAAKLPLDQLAAWADQTFPSGPMRQPVNDLLNFVEQATELAGARRDRSNPTIDDLIDQAKTVFGFPKDGPDPVAGLRDLFLAPTVGQVGQQDPLGQLAPGLAAIAAPVLGFLGVQMGGLAPVLGFLAPVLALASNPAQAIGAVLTSLRDTVSGFISDSRHNAALPVLALPVVALFAAVPLLFVAGIAIAGVLALGAVVLGAILLAPLIIGALIIGGLILAAVAIPVLIVLAVIAIPVLLIAIPVGFVAFQVLAPVILAAGLAAFAVAVVGGVALAAIVLAVGLAVQITGFALLLVIAALATIFVPFLGLLIGPLAFTVALGWLVLGGLAVAAAFFGTLGVAALVALAVFAVVGLLSLFTPFGLIAIPILLALGAAALVIFGAVGLAGAIILAAVGFVEFVALGVMGGATVTVLLALALVSAAIQMAATVIMWAFLSAAAIFMAAAGAVATTLAVIGGLFATAALVIGVPILGPLLAPLLFIALVAVPAVLGLSFLFGGFTFAAFLVFLCSNLALFTIGSLAGTVLVASLVFMITMPWAIPIILLADLAFAIIVGAALAVLAAANIVFTWFFGGSVVLGILAFTLAAVATVFAGGLALGVLSFAMLTIAAAGLIIINPPLALLALPVIFGGLLLSVLSMFGTAAVVGSLLTGFAAFLGFGLVAAWVAFGVMTLGTMIAVSAVFPPFLLVTVPVAIAAFVAIAALAIATLTLFGGGLGAILVAGNVLALALSIAAVVATAAVGIAGFVLAAALTLPFLIFGPLAPVVSTALMPILALGLLALWSPVFIAGLVAAGVGITTMLLGLIGMPLLAAIVVGGFFVVAKGIALTLFLGSLLLSFGSIAAIAALALPVLLPVLGLMGLGALALLALPVLAVLAVPVLGLAALGGLALLAIPVIAIAALPVLALLAAFAVPLLALAALGALAVVALPFLVGGAAVAGAVLALGAALAIGIPLALLIGVPLLALAAVGVLALLALPVLLIGGALAALVGVPLAALGALALLALPVLALAGLVGVPLAALGALALPVLALAIPAAAIGVPALAALALLTLAAIAIALLLSPPVRVWIISAIRAGQDPSTGGSAATGTQFLDSIPDNPSLEQLIAGLQQLLAPQPSAAPVAEPLPFASLPYAGKGAAEGVTHDRAGQLVSMSV
ncbi:hypothetical protein [Nocardia sp. NPDC052566]|uniref:hypothetical protein n=1 Tax=Nocardia sp. NPDC052566 TaxID=3364330 RepID=UPI0037C8D281